LSLKSTEYAHLMSEFNCGIFYCNLTTSFSSVRSMS
jgi:hypothetical protein